MNQDAENKPTERAVVLLSGGLDSTTCLAYAKAKHQQCFCLSVNYGQKHNAEISAAKRIAQTFDCKHRIVDIDIGQFGGSALTDSEISVPTPEKPSDGIPLTYVPARNTIMLAIELGWAEVLNAEPYILVLTRLIILAIPIVARSTSRRLINFLVLRPQAASRGAQ